MTAPKLAYITHLVVVLAEYLYLMRLLVPEKESLT